MSVLEVGEIWRTWILNRLQVNSYVPRWSVSFAEFLVKIISLRTVRDETSETRRQTTTIL